jgi:hypothetical protein
MRHQILVLLAGLTVAMASSFGATVQLSDGRIADGTVVRQTPLFIYLNTGGDTYEISRSDITWFSSTTVDHRLLDEGEVPGPCVGLNGIECSYIKNSDAPAVQAEPDHRTVRAPATNVVTEAVEEREPQAVLPPAPPQAGPILPTRPAPSVNRAPEPEPINTSHEAGPLETNKTVEPAPATGRVDTVRPASPVPVPRTFPNDLSGVNEGPKLPSTPPPEGQSPYPQTILGPPYVNPPPAAGPQVPAPANQQEGATAPQIRDSGEAPTRELRERRVVNDVTPPPPALPFPRTEAEINRLREAIPMLSDSADPSDRTQAIETLHSAGDPGLAILVEDGLYNAIPSIRTRAADLLGTWGGQRVLKPLIEAFYSAAYPTLPSYQIDYVQTLAGQLSRLTNQDFYFYARRSARAPEVAAAMISWWDQNWDRVPPQLGEPELDPTHSGYKEMLKIERSLALIHRDFAGSNLPPEIAGPPQPNSPADQEFLRTIPVIPSGSINSYGDRANTSQEPTVLKVPDPSRDAPGRFREGLYAERLREAEANRTLP